MTLFLCHNCSNINSNSGEACIILAPDDRKDEILHGHMPCMNHYTVPLTEKERRESPFIIADDFEWDFETDFYKVESEEAKRNHKYVLSNDLWVVNFSVMLPYSNEEMLWMDAEEQICKWRSMRYSERSMAFKLNKMTSEACAFFDVAKPCRIETDPILIK